jgi:hypothetical protein
MLARCFNSLGLVLFVDLDMLLMAIGQNYQLTQKRSKKRFVRNPPVKMECSLID